MPARERARLTPLVANALDAAGQHMQQEPADELGTNNGLIHLLDGHWNRMRRLEQPPDASRIGLDLPSRDAVVLQDLEVEHRASIEAEPIANFLRDGDLALAGKCGEHDEILKLDSDPYIHIV